MYPYEKLRPANVVGTLTAIELASYIKQKSFVFISSTSAIDTEHYVQLSDSLSGGPPESGGVPESDDLEGARFTLKTGYGQTKWVSEKLLFEAGRRGLKGHILRPGYIVGDSRTAGKRLLTYLISLTYLRAFSNQHGRLYLALGQGLHSAGPCPGH